MMRYIVLIWKKIIVTGKYLIRRLVSALGMLLFFFSNSAVAKAPEGYRSIANNKVESEKFELRKTNIDFARMQLLFDPLTNNIIVGNGSNITHCYKMNEKGYVVDSFSRDSTLLISGVFFDEFTYVDWAITGNKVPQKYSEIIDADALTEKEFKRYISSADEVDYNKFYGKNERVRVYLKIKDSWMVLETAKRFNDFSTDINDSHYEVKSTVYPKKLRNRLVPLTAESYRNNWKNPDNKIIIKHFKKEGSSSSRFMDINGMTWDGDYGTGYFQIKHQDDVLYFKAHTTKSYSKFSPDIEVYVVPDEYSSKVNISLIELSRHSKNKRSVEEAGLYVLRDKINLTDELIEDYEKRGVSFGTYLFHKLKIDWKPVFTGFFEGQGALSKINYFTESVEEFNMPLMSEFESKKRTLPKEIVFNWNGFEGVEGVEGVINIMFNAEIYQWNVSNKPIYIKLLINREELIETFQMLNVDDRPIEIKMAMEKIDDHHVFLSTWASNGIKSFQLNLIDLVTRDNNSEINEKELTQYFEKARLDLDYQAALKNFSVLPAYFNTSEFIARYSDYTDDYAFVFADQTTKMLIASLSNSDFKHSKQLLMHYIETLMPRTGRNKKADDVASIGLILCINSKDSDTCKIIFDKLLPELDVAKLDNEVLLYNLACYYSINNDKANMLKSIKQSIKHGKAAAQFIQDADFKAYKKDTDFLDAINFKP